MFKWISKHKIWSSLLFITIVWTSYIAYNGIQKNNLSFTSPVIEMDTINKSKPLIAMKENVTYDRIIEIIKILVPILVVIITYKHKGTMDEKVMIIIRENISDRRKISKSVNVERRKNSKFINTEKRKKK